MLNMAKKHTSHIKALPEIGALGSCANAELIQDHRVTAYDGVTAVHERGSVVGYCAMTELPTEEWLTKTFRIADHGGAGSAMALAVAERRMQKAIAEQATPEDRHLPAAPVEVSPEVEDAWPPVKAVALRLDPVREEPIAVSCRSCTPTTCSG